MGVEDPGTAARSVGEGSPPSPGRARDPGRPIPRYGYDYEKYGNSALKDVK